MKTIKKMSMRLQRIAIISIASFVSIAAHGQLFHPLGLGEALGGSLSSPSYARMHVEENNLYVCTNQGLYCKDLSDDESEWRLAGFEGIPLFDYARSGNDILALRHNADSCFLLLSHDGGQTYEDITSTELVVIHPRVQNMLIRLVQHPDDPNTLLVLSNIWGMYRSSDFGRTWSKLGGEYLSVGSSIGFHPARPEIIYNSGANDIYLPIIFVTYDDGQTWSYIYPFWNGDGFIYFLAFDPSNPDRWILSGGRDGIATSDDNGHTWDLQVFSGSRKCDWGFTAFDNENSDIVYTAGTWDVVKVMCSTDGGRSWLAPLDLGTDRKGLRDLQQYGDKLLIYTTTDVYEISKAKLLAFGQCDVTFDGRVDIADVNEVINVMLHGLTPSPSPGGEGSLADITGDGQVDIADVNAVINAMLGK